MYQQPGGEDQVFAAEAALLEAHGHWVLRYSVHNDQAAGMNPVALAGSTVWNRSSYRELRSLIRQERPQVAHFHNTLPLISPAGYYARGQGRRSTCRSDSTQLPATVPERPFLSRRARL